MSSNCVNLSIVDVNDAFDSIAFVEDKVVLNGFREGYNKGECIGEYEGYHLGYHRGAEIGAEVGFYKGFVEAFVRNYNLSNDSQLRPIIEKLNRLMESFPRFNDDSTDIINLKTQMRSLYKRLCSLLKTDTRIPEDLLVSF